MSEESKPFAEIMIDDELYPVTNKNLSLYRHLGVNAIYDHCYIARPNSNGAYIWAYNPIFDTYAKLAEEHCAYTVLNKPEPSDSDRNWYIAQATEDKENADDFARRWVAEQAEI